MELDDLIRAPRSEKPLSLGGSGESMVLDNLIGCYLDVRSPFDGMLEAPPSVHEIWVRQGKACRVAA